MRVPQILMRRRRSRACALIRVWVKNDIVKDPGRNVEAPIFHNVVLGSDLLFSDPISELCGRNVGAQTKSLGAQIRWAAVEPAPALKQHAG